MIANHYPLMFATRFNWLIVAIVLAIGPVIRHFFNSRHEGKGSPWWTWGVAAAGMIAVAWLSGAGPGGLGARADKVDAQAAENTVLVRCSMCHRGEPVWPGRTQAAVVTVTSRAILGVENVEICNLIRANVLLYPRTATRQKERGDGK